MESRQTCLCCAALSLMSCGSVFGRDDLPSQLQFRLLRDHLVVVKGSIGVMEGLDFLIDTGATQTLVDVKTIEALGLARTAEVRVESLKDTRAHEVLLPPLRFGPVRVESARVLATDLSFTSASGATIEVIVGLDVLALTSFSLDYTARRITFGPVDESASTVVFATVSPLLTIDAVLGERTARLLVDTGAARLTLFPNRMRGRLPNFLLKGAVTGLTAGGTSELRDVELAAVRLGPTEWRRVRAFLVDVQASSFAVDGVLAPSSLAVRRLGFDFERGRLSWAMK